MKPIRFLLPMLLLGLAACSSDDGGQALQPDDAALDIVTRIAVLDAMADADGAEATTPQTRWTHHSLEFHGEGVAQSVVYGYDFLARAGGVDDLARGTSRVEIVHWPTAVAAGGDWLANAQDCFETCYAAGCRIFTMAFGSQAVATPAFDAWLVQFALAKEAAGDPILVCIGAGNDPRNTSTFGSTPAAFGGLHFYPNFLATAENDFLLQVAGIEDNLDAVRWCGYESDYSDAWKVDLATTIKLWDFDEDGDPNWWGYRVGTSFSCGVAAGAIGYLQALARWRGYDPTVAALRDLLLDEAIGLPFASGGEDFDFPVVEIHTDDNYTDWAEQAAYALDPTLGIVMQWDDETDTFVTADGQPSVTKRIVRRGLLAPANASIVVQAFEAAYPVAGPVATASPLAP